MTKTTTADPAATQAGIHPVHGRATAASNSTGYTAVVYYPASTGDPKLRDAAVEDLFESAAGHPGHRSSVILRGGSPVATDLHMVLTFDSRDSWQQWESSDPARRAIARLDRVTGTPGDGHLVDSMAGWFNLPELSGVEPPKWKSAVVSFVALVPLLFLIQILLAPLTGGLDRNVTGILSAIVMILLATYFVLPFMTRLLRGWLYPRTSTGLTEAVPDSGRGAVTTVAT